MKIIKSISEMHEHCKQLKSEGKIIASVDTDAELHAGHMALVKIAKENADVVVLNSGHSVDYKEDSAEEYEKKLLEYRQLPYGFSRDIELAKSNGEQLNTREQAHNLLHNLKELKKIQFDFKNIEVVGPAFADELVRKTKKKNQTIDISWVNSSDLVDALMSRAINRSV